MLANEICAQAACNSLRRGSIVAQALEQVEIRSDKQGWMLPCVAVGISDRFTRQSDNFVVAEHGKTKNGGFVCQIVVLNVNGFEHLLVEDATRWFYRLVVVFGSDYWS